MLLGGWVGGDTNTLLCFVCVWAGVSGVWELLFTLFTLYLVAWVGWVVLCMEEVGWMGWILCKAFFFFRWSLPLRMGG